LTAAVAYSMVAALRASDESRPRALG
jgi:hypothetical protein